MIHFLHLIIIKDTGSQHVESCSSDLFFKVEIKTLLNNVFNTEYPTSTWLQVSWGMNVSGELWCIDVYFVDEV